MCYNISCRTLIRFSSPPLFPQQTLVLNHIAPKKGEGSVKKNRCKWTPRKLPFVQLQQEMIRVGGLPIHPSSPSPKGLEVHQVAVTHLSWLPNKRRRDYIPHAALMFHSHFTSLNQHLWTLPWALASPCWTIVTNRLVSWETTLLAFPIASTELNAGVSFLYILPPSSFLKRLNKTRPWIVGAFYLIAFDLWGLPVKMLWFLLLGKLGMQFEEHPHAVYFTLVRCRHIGPRCSNCLILLMPLSYCHIQLLLLMNEIYPCKLAGMQKCAGLWRGDHGHFAFSPVLLLLNKVSHCLALYCLKLALWLVSFQANYGLFLTCCAKPWLSPELCGISRIWGVMKQQPLSLHLAYLHSRCGLELCWNEPFWFWHWQTIYQLDQEFLWAELCS